MVELVINLGKRNGLSPKKLMNLIHTENDSGSVDIGRININQMQSYFNVSSAAAQGVIDGFAQNPCTFDRRGVSVSRAGKGDPAKRDQKRAARQTGQRRKKPTL